MIRKAAIRSGAISQSFIRPPAAESLFVVERVAPLPAGARLATGPAVAPPSSPPAPAERN